MNNSSLWLELLEEITSKCPMLVKSCYWAGTTAIALEELNHRESFDLDFHSDTALLDARPLLAELKIAFKDRLQVIQAPDSFGGGFRVTIKSKAGESLVIEVLSNFEDIPDYELVHSKLVPNLRRVSLNKYLKSKVQYLVERNEARDLVDIAATLAKFPNSEGIVKAFVLKQDAVLMAERLLNWKDEDLAQELSIYGDDKKTLAVFIKEKILLWLKES